MSDAAIERWQAWVAAEAEAGAPVIVAATVVVLRDASTGPEVLLLRRNTAVEFAGGLWVFPGGRVDPGDGEREQASDVLAAARRAAVREAVEEAGIALDDEGLVWFAHWAPPRRAPKRFATFFFVSDSSDAAVTIDGSEIHDHVWVTATAALDRHARGEIDLAPPTWMTLHALRERASVADAVAALGTGPPPFYETHIARRGEDPATAETWALWQGDAAYDSGDLDAPGPRHRLLMRRGGWVLERTDGLAPTAPTG